jgi:hypothetical protein
MAGWKRIKGHFDYDASKFTETVGGVEIVAKLYDCDGDFVSWSVYENGKFVAGADVRADGKTIKSEEDAWNLAKRRAELVICYGIDGIRKLMEKQKAENVPVSA